jgi:hypothetical protein
VVVSGAAEGAAFWAGAALVAALLPTNGFVRVCSYLDEQVARGVIAPSRLDHVFFCSTRFGAQWFWRRWRTAAGAMVAVGETTLATTFLVAFWCRRESLEATWKYLILCSVSISLALFGVVLAYYSSLHARNIFPDFPLINKSFQLSCAGHDLYILRGNCVLDGQRSVRGVVTWNGAEARLPVSCEPLKEGREVFCRPPWLDEGALGDLVPPLSLVRFSPCDASALSIPAPEDFPVSDIHRQLPLLSHLLALYFQWSHENSSSDVFGTRLARNLALNPVGTDRLLYG